MGVPNFQATSSYSPLPLSVPHHPLEPCTSFISRLAARNGIETVTDFCRDIGFPYKSLIAGDPHAIKLLAQLGGCNANDLQHVSIRNLGRNALRLRDEIATTHTLQRSRVRICPTCIRQDIDGRNEIWRAWRRITWQFVSVRSCAAHDCALVNLPVEKHTLHGYDFSVQIRKHLANLSEFDTRPQMHTEFEAYLSSRIGGLRSQNWLDRLELNVASRACEVFGLLLVRGAEAKLSGHSDPEWAEYGEIGYQIFRHGAGAVNETLSELLRDTKADIRFFSNVYGPFTAWLNGRGLGEEFEPLRDLVRRHIFSNFRVRSGVLVLGMPSLGQGGVATQANDVNLENYPRELRASLVERGLAHEDKNGLIQANGFLTEMMLAGIKREFNNLVDTETAADFLGVSVDALRIYVEAGFLVKRMEPISNLELFDRGNLEWLAQSKILEGINLPDGTLDLDRIAKPKPLRVDDVAKRLKVTRKSVHYLLQSGFLAETDKPLDKRGGTRALSDFSVSAFEFNFVSLGQLAVDHKVRLGAMAIRLRNLNVPLVAMPPNFSRFFWRGDT